MASGRPVPGAFAGASRTLAPLLAVLAPALLPLLAGVPTALPVATLSWLAMTLPAIAATVPVTFTVTAFMPTALATPLSATPCRLVGRLGRAADISSALVLMSVPSATGAAIRPPGSFRLAPAGTISAPRLRLVTRTREVINIAKVGEPPVRPDELRQRTRLPGPLHADLGILGHDPRL